MGAAAGVGVAGVGVAAAELAGEVDGSTEGAAEGLAAATGDEGPLLLPWRVCAALGVEHPAISTSAITPSAVKFRLN